MNTPTTLGVFALGLAATFGLAAGLGSAVGPVWPASTQAQTGGGAEQPAPTGGPDHTADMPGMGDR